MLCLMCNLCVFHMLVTYMGWKSGGRQNMEAIGHIILLLSFKCLLLGAKE